MLETERLLSVKESQSKEMNRLLREVFTEIKPGKREKEETRQIAERITEEVASALADVPFTNVEIQGSYAKGTWLSEETDLDLFIILDKQVTRERIKKILKTVERELPHSFSRRYAEHPYLRTEIAGRGVDIVPAFKVGEKLSAVDRTPKHTTYVRENLSEAEKNEVRLLKKFLRGIGSYGAEIRVGGFSGMACEILVKEVGSFYSVLSHFQKNHELFLDPTAGWDKEKAFDFFDSDLVAIDPTDRERNLLAALRLEKFCLTKVAAECFLADPRRKFFFPVQPKVKEEEVKREIEQRAILLVRFFLRDNVPPDTFWGQAKRAERKIGKVFQRSTFKFYASDVWKVNNEIHLAIELGSLNKPSRCLVMGPPPRVRTENIREFIETYAGKVGPWIGYSGRLIAEDTVEEMERKAKTECQRRLETLKLDPSFSDFEVVDDPNEIFDVSKTSGEMINLVKFLKRKLPWLY